MSENLQLNVHQAHCVNFKTQSYNKKMEFANKLRKKSNISAIITKIKATGCLSDAYFGCLFAL